MSNLAAECAANPEMPGCPMPSGDSFASSFMPDFSSFSIPTTVPCFTKKCCQDQLVPSFTCSFYEKVVRPKAKPVPKLLAPFFQSSRTNFILDYIETITCVSAHSCLVFKKECRRHSEYNIDLKNGSPLDKNQLYTMKDFESIFGITPLYEQNETSLFTEFEKDTIVWFDKQYTIRYPESNDLAEKINEYFQTHREGHEDRLYVKWENRQKGFGVFANQTFKTGDIVSEYTGTLYKEDADNPLVFDTDFVWSYPKSEKAKEKRANLGLDSKKSGNYLRFANHAGQSASTRPFFVPYNNRWHLFYVASKDIKIDERITTDYGPAYFKDRPDLGKEYDSDEEEEEEHAPHSHYDIPMKDGVPVDKDRKYIVEDFKNIFHVNYLYHNIDTPMAKRILDRIVVWFSDAYEKRWENIHMEMDKVTAHYNAIDFFKPRRDFYIKWASKDLGFALFSNRTFEIGDLVDEYTGETYVEYDDTDQWTDTDYTWAYPRSKAYPEGSSFGIDARVNGNMMRFSNHAGDDANTDSLFVPYNNRWHIFYIAIKKINPGDEITADYGANYFKTRNLNP